MKKREIQSTDSLENEPPWDSVLRIGIQAVLDRKKRFMEQGIIGADGRRLSNELPPDMLDDSESSV